MTEYVSTSQYDHGFSPRPYDLRNMTLTREMQNLAEKLAENSHDLWAKRKKQELEEIGLFMWLFEYFRNVVDIRTRTASQDQQ